MAPWRERLFGVMLRAAEDPVVAVALPPDQTTTMSRTLPI